MPPDDGGNDKNKKETQKKIDNILKDTQKGKETTGRATQYEKSGNFNTAKQDFNSLQPKNVKTENNRTITGELPDGKRVNVRNDSRDGRPTLEIQNPKGQTKKQIKIRYGSK